MSRSSSKEAVELEKRHVHDIYSHQAHHFHNNHYTTWPKVRHFINSLPSGSLVADIGCGNGKYLDVNKDVVMIGSDICLELAEIAGGRGKEITVCDNLQLPYRNNVFDAILSVGVIHHFAMPKRRSQAVQELSRVTRPGGLIMIYVWAIEQKRRKFSSQDVLVPWIKDKRSPKLLSQNITLQTDLKSAAVMKESKNVNLMGDNPEKVVSKSDNLKIDELKCDGPQVDDLKFENLKKSYSKNFDINSDDNKNGKLKKDDSKIGSSNNDILMGSHLKKDNLNSVNLKCQDLKSGISKNSNLKDPRIDSVPTNEKISNPVINLEVKQSFIAKCQNVLESLVTGQVFKHHQSKDVQIVDSCRVDDSDARTRFQHVSSFSEIDGFAVRQFPQSSWPRETDCGEETEMASSLNNLASVEKSMDCKLKSKDENWSLDTEDSDEMSCENSLELLVGPSCEVDDARRKVRQTSFHGSLQDCRSSSKETSSYTSIDLLCQTSDVDRRCQDSFCQPSYDYFISFENNDITKKYKPLISKPAKCHLPERSKSVDDDLKRYYHLFCKGELVQLVQQIPCLRVIQDFHDHGNWCVVAEKI